ncbi:hypothetical protein [Longimicrobium sp.]|uniref:hypothetical protein n=1 Tax=Longimicrobium sp. TaxID=2029185 RepID=UPI002E2FA858|nr:hypothetical protein [Longimicrobium sp.]HEX6040295.1 hypothetical protein [Longimicrobium sp.]
MHHKQQLRVGDIRVASFTVGGGGVAPSTTATADTCLSAVTCSGTCSPAWCPVPTGA